MNYSSERYLHDLRKHEGADLSEVFPKYDGRMNALNDFVRDHKLLLALVGGLIVLICSLTAAAFGEEPARGSFTLPPDDATWLCDTEAQMREQIDVNTRLLAVGETPHEVDGCGVLVKELQVRVRSHRRYVNEFVIVMIYELDTDELGTQFWSEVLLIMDPNGRDTRDA